MRKKLVVLLMACLVVVGMMPKASLASQMSVSYLAWDEEEKKLVAKSCSNYVELTSMATAWNNAWYVVSGEIVIEERIVVTGTVHLILKDSSRLIANAGITVEDENELIIHGQSSGNKMGELQANGTKMAAGIGGTAANNSNEDDIDGSGGQGIIQIDGGRITANGGEWAAGIGGGYQGYGKTVIINGGTVQATGGNQGAGIGSGDYSPNQSGEIIINGGNITAQGGSSAAGIGGGLCTESGEITINGGTIDSTGGNGGAGIGAGQSRENGNIIINGGNIRAEGGERAAGIGTGYCENGESGPITFNGGSVAAIAGDGAAGIGGGYRGFCGNITINDGSLHAIAGDGGAAIGIGSLRGNQIEHLPEYSITIKKATILMEVNGSSGYYMSKAPDYIEHNKPDYATYVYNENNEKVYTEVSDSGATICTDFTQGEGLRIVDDHKYTVSQHDTTKHWKKCYACDSIDEQHAHAYSNYNCTKSNKCTNCAYEQPATKANHTYGGWINVGNGKHRHSCTNAGCTVSVEKAHVANADDGNCTTAVLCKDCGAVVTAAKTSHSYGSWIDIGNGKHRHSCTNAGCTVSVEKAHVANADDGNCTTAVLCKDCGAVVTAAKTSHSYGSWIDIGNGKHRHSCTNAGCTVSVEKAHVANADDGNCMTEVLCKDCGAVVTAAKTSHSYGSWIDIGDGKHRHSCTNAGCSAHDEQSHVPAADDDDCTTPVLCQDCGVVVTAAKTSHSYGSWIDIGDGKHRHSCTNAGCTAHDEQSHVPAADDDDCTTPVLCQDCGAVVIEAQSDIQPEDTGLELPSGYSLFASDQGYDFAIDGNGNVRCYDKQHKPVINKFMCDGTNTYYFQADGTAMRDRLTYHPDGVHVIYFNEYGHEVFSDFANVKKSIAGEAVDDLCFFNVYGYMYVDTLTYDKTGTKLYYINPYGVMECSGWFQFSGNEFDAGLGFTGTAGGYGYANADGSLFVNSYTYDWEGRYCYLQGDGHALY